MKYVLIINGMVQILDKMREVDEAVLAAVKAEYHWEPEIVELCMGCVSDGRLVTITATNQTTQHYVNAAQCARVKEA